MSQIRVCANEQRLSVILSKGTFTSQSIAVNILTNKLIHSVFNLQEKYEIYAYLCTRAFQSNENLKADV